jgi:hypothetical protein
LTPQTSLLLASASPVPIFQLYDKRKQRDHFFIPFEPLRKHRLHRLLVGSAGGFYHPPQQPQPLY